MLVHESKVHNEKSLHTAASSLPVLVAETQPVALLHDPTKHLSFVTAQELEMSVKMHVLLTHVS